MVSPQTTPESVFFFSQAHDMHVFILDSIRTATYYRTDLQELDLLVKHYKFKDISRNNAPFATRVMQFCFLK